MKPSNILLIEAVLHMQKADPSFPSLDDNSSVLSMDSGAELAVMQINNRSDILPGVTLQIKRVNVWDPALLDETDNANSAGYAMSSLNDALASSSVAAVFGEYYSKSSIFTAETAGHYRKPFCGVSQGTVSLADKENYPYFFRLQNTKGSGRHVLQLLRQWNVHRIAVLSATDTLSASVADDTSSYLEAHGISSYDLHYIYVSAITNLLASFYAYTSKTDMIGPEYVYMIWNPPFEDVLQVSDELGNALAGVQYITTDTLPLNYSTFVTFNDTWTALNAVNPQKYEITDGGPAGYSTSSYDCINLIAYGLDQLLKSDPSLKPEMIADGTLAANLTYKAFQNTGYHGIVWDPVMLNEHFDYWDRTFAFGSTNVDASVYTPLSQANFYNGSTVPPADATVLYETIPIVSDSPLSFVLWAIMGLGLLASLVTLGYVNTRRALPVGDKVFSTLCLVGCSIGLLSIPTHIGRVAVGPCALGMSLPFIGFGFLFGAILVKSGFVAKSLKNTYQRERGVPWAKVLAVSVLLAAANGLLVFGTHRLSGVTAGQVFSDATHYSYACGWADGGAKGMKPLAAIIAIDTAVLLVCVRNCHRNSKAMELQRLDSFCKLCVAAIVTLALVFGASTVKIAIMVFILWAICLCCIAMIAFQPLPSKSDHHTKSVGSRSEGALARMIESVNNEDVPDMPNAKEKKVNKNAFHSANLGKVRFQYRAFMGWSKPRKAAIVYFEHPVKSRSCLTFVSLETPIGKPMTFNLNSLLSDENDQGRHMRKQLMSANNLTTEKSEQPTADGDEAQGEMVFTVDAVKSTSSKSAPDLKSPSSKSLPDLESGTGLVHVHDSDRKNGGHHHGRCVNVSTPKVEIKIMCTSSGQFVHLEKVLAEVAKRNGKSKKVDKAKNNFISAKMLPQA
ncbi:hypothetical protein HK101_006275 [Irineochytrium annulatum]|nr:hypothetical protein HK101_006275 [Irineochytrium annulatum]